MKKVCLIGSDGYVGSEIAKILESTKKYNLIRLVRGDDFIKKINSSDIIIHSANPAKRFFANNNPDLDYKETVEKTMKFLKKSIGKKFILISSISCRTQLNTSYGINRKKCEAKWQAFCVLPALCSIGTNHGWDWKKL